MLPLSTISVPSCSGTDIRKRKNDSDSENSVPSCSGTDIRKRKNDGDSENSGVKVPRGNYYSVSESESIPISEDNSESILSLQNKSTDFCRDTSDTCTKTSGGSDSELKYELVSLSEGEGANQHPFDTYSSGTDSETMMKRQLQAAVRSSGSKVSESSVWADYSESEDSRPRVMAPGKIRACLKCKAPTCFAHYCYKSDGTESPLLEDHPNSTLHEEKPKQLVKYGELVILGYNGSLPSGDRGRRRSKFVLYKRATPNGVKRSRHYVVNTPHSSQAILDSRQHSISYTLSCSQAIIVEYMPDEETDMFQIGRSSETPIDFVVMDTIPRDKAGESKVMASTISRFACRILVDRSYPHVARIYAAGFDSSRNIFLGEKATKWEEGQEVDGLTTNGVLIMHPPGKFCGGETGPKIWREVSVGGGIFTIRKSRFTQVKGVAVEGVSNVLKDGTLIDLGGATLLWRSAEGLANSPTKEYLEKLVDQVNAGRPVCPVGLNTLVIPRKSTLDHEKRQPHVYLECGHIQGHHDWRHEKANFRCCPVCLKVGLARKLCMGIEPAFYVDSGPPDFFAFNPCGHMATEKTVNYWANVPLPHGTDGFDIYCPFCATIVEGFPGYVHLIFN